MMITTESFYEDRLKNKSKEQILSIINELKSEIEDLKDIAEHPHYNEHEGIKPSARVRFICTRRYLQQAYLALEEIGESYTLSPEELKAADFQKNIKHISKITLNIGPCMSPPTEYALELGEDSVRSVASLSGTIIEEMILDKETVLDDLKELHMGEWREHYTPERFGHIILDGIEWNVVIEYNNGRKPVEFRGANVYPANFFGLSGFLSVFCLESADITPELLEED